MGKSELGKSLTSNKLAAMLDFRPLFRNVDLFNKIESSFDQARTRGVAVRPVSIEGAEFSMWDFAGQQEV